MALSPDLGLFLMEQLTSADALLHAVDEVLVDKRSTIQHIQVVRSPTLGLGLILDGLWQTCEADEFLYHEPLAHPAMLLHGSPRRVLILGGGDGGLLREVLRWRTVEYCLLVDIDAEVLAVSRQLLGPIHQGAFDDPRVQTLTADAWDVLRGEESGWDVILSDLTDPVENGPAARLFTREFFTLCRQALSKDGVFALQAGEASPPMDLFGRVSASVASTFEHVLPFASHVPSYGVSMGFVLASQRSLNVPTAEEAEAGLNTGMGGGLRMLDGVALHGLLHAPRHVRLAMDTAGGSACATLNEPVSLERNVLQPR